MINASWMKDYSAIIMSMTKDCPTPELSSVVAVEEDEDEIELSLGLSIGRGFRRSPKLQNSGENLGVELTDVVVASPNKADRSLLSRCSVAQTLGYSEQESDSHLGDTEGNSKVQTRCTGKERKRKRHETPTNGFEEKMWYDAIRERSNERETIGCKSFTNGEINSSDAQVFSPPAPQQNESGILRPVVGRSFSLNQGNHQEPVTGGSCSGGKDDESARGMISPAGSSSILSSGFKSSSSQQDGSSKSGEESGTDPIGIHSAITASEVISNPNIIGPCPRRHHHHHKPPPTNSTQLEERHSNHQNFRPPRIPCVSTTGNGPNGRKVSGFLYKYTNAEVSIVCACHGSSFSPAQFVEHAGGVNISHPLRHITVIPSTFCPFPS